MLGFLYGATAALCAVAGLCFARFWHEWDDALFINFAAAFWLLAVNYAILGLVHFATEARPYVFLLRLSAFALILIGIAAKTRS